jgi:hypothetical protein
VQSDAIVCFLLGTLTRVERRLSKPLRPGFLNRVSEVRVLRGASRCRRHNDFPAQRDAGCTARSLVQWRFEPGIGENADVRIDARWRRSQCFEPAGTDRPEREL